MKQWTAEQHLPGHKTFEIISLNSLLSDISPSPTTIKSSPLFHDPYSKIPLTSLWNLFPVGELATQTTFIDLTSAMLCVSSAKLAYLLEVHTTSVCWSTLLVTAS